MASPEPLLYFLAMTIPGTSDPHLHMTVCTIQEARFLETGTAIDDIKAMAELVMPLRIAFGEHQMFGKEKDVPVRLITILEPQKKVILDDFVLTYFKPLPEEVHRGETQVFHASVDKLSPAEALALETATLDRMYLSIVGQKGLVLWSNK